MYTPYHTYIYTYLSLSLSYYYESSKTIEEPVFFSLPIHLACGQFRGRESNFAMCMSIRVSRATGAILCIYIYIFTYLFIFIYIYIHKSYVHILDKIVVAKWLKGVTKWLNQSVLS